MLGRTGLFDSGAQLGTAPARPLPGMTLPGDRDETDAEQQDRDSRAEWESRQQDAGQGTEREQWDVLRAGTGVGVESGGPAVVAERGGDGEVEGDQRPQQRPERGASLAKRQNEN